MDGGNVSEDYQPFLDHQTNESNFCSFHLVVFPTFTIELLQDYLMSPGKSACSTCPPVTINLCVHDALRKRSLKFMTSVTRWSFTTWLIMWQRTRSECSPDKALSYLKPWMCHQFKQFDVFLANLFFINSITVHVQYVLFLYIIFTVLLQRLSNVQ